MLKLFWNKKEKEKLLEVAFNEIYQNGYIASLMLREYNKVPK